ADNPDGAAKRGRVYYQRGHGVRYDVRRLRQRQRGALETCVPALALAQAPNVVSNAVTTLVINPAAFGCAVRIISAISPLASVPRLKVMTLSLVKLTARFALRNETEADHAFVTRILAKSPSRLVTEMV